MSSSGIDPNDLFFDSDSFLDFETLVDDNGSAVDKGHDVRSTIVQFHPLVSICDGSVMPLAGGVDNFWDTRQYVSESTEVPDLENSGSFSLNELGSLSDESLSDFIPKEQHNSLKDTNGVESARPVRYRDGFRNFDGYESSRTLWDSINDDEIDFANEAQINTANTTKLQNVKMHQDHVFSKDDILMPPRNSKFTRTGQEQQITSATSNANSSTNVSTSSAQVVPK
jgi:hypothetical protein